MKRDDLHWPSGLLEGEGCFTTAGGRGRRPMPALKVSMADRDVMQRVATLLGYALIREYSPWLRRHGWKPAYKVSVTGQPAQRLMRQLYPLLGKRRQRRIRELLRWRPLPSGRRRTLEAA